LVADNAKNDCAQLMDHHMLREEYPSRPYLIKNYFFHRILDILTVGSQKG